MNRRMTIIALALAGLAAALLPHGAAFVQEKMRVSVDTNATRVRNVPAVSTWLPHLPMR